MIGVISGYFFVLVLFYPAKTVARRTEHASIVDTLAGPQCGDDVFEEWQSLGYIVSKNKGNGRVYLKCVSTAVEQKVSCKRDECNDKKWCFVKNHCGGVFKKKRCREIELAERCPTAMDLLIKAETVEDCDKALQLALVTASNNDYEGFGAREPQNVKFFVKASLLDYHMECYKLAPKFMKTNAGPDSTDEFVQQMQRVATMVQSLDLPEALRAKAECKNVEAVASEIQKVGKWTDEIDYIPFQSFLKYQDQLWDNFFNAFESTVHEQKQLTVAVSMGGNNGAGSYGKSCSSSYPHVLFCKSTLWSLVHSWKYLRQTSKLEKYNFSPEVELLFYNRPGSETIKVPVVQTKPWHIMLHLQDASYSGREIAKLTHSLVPADEAVKMINIGMSVIGDRAKLEAKLARRENTEQKIGQCPLTPGQRCFIFGHNGGEGLAPKACPDESHFVVQHKAADGFSLGTDCACWYKALGLISPYKRKHSELPFY